MLAKPEPAQSALMDSNRLGQFSNRADHVACRKLHQRYGTTYYFASQWFPPASRRAVNALYAFVRVPDEWVDNPRGLSLAEQREELIRYRNQFLRGLDGVRPDYPSLRAFCDVVHTTKIPIEEPLCFLDAMEQDIDTHRYRTYEDLRGYMRGSASAVGIMMCYVIGARVSPDVLDAASKLGEAMQLTNFLRDVKEDAARGRIYLPREDCERFGVTEESIFQGQMTADFRELMKFQIARARDLYAQSDEGISALPADGQKPVRLARILYSRILDRIEAQNYDVFLRRARTSRLEKLGVALRVAFELPV